ncbi:complement component receptor 1-like protein isoform X2 [Brachyhypopomus gauderio]|uniref:complement component receptor 1-like protein isoform X2 n=1 Tax=Brachyhypopomus gauderio TaxID=698409 RepID=UPI0040429DFD
MDILWTTLLFVSATLIVSEGSNKCGLPNVYKNKRLDEKYLHIREFNNGDKVTYKCDEGYAQSQGRRDSVCVNGRWTLLNMQCKKKKCGSAGDIVNGRFNQEGNLFGDKAFAECNEGYVLQGAPFRQCLDNGWSDTIPTCVESHLPSQLSRSSAPKGCKKPTAKNIVLNRTAAVYKPGEHLLIACPRGFLLEGDSVVHCDRGGKWNKPPPKCSRIKCPRLNILNGVVSSRVVAVDTTVKVSCKSGFELRGADHITCDASGSWTPTVPTCEPYSGQCGQLPFHLNTVPTERQLGPYKHGSHVQFRCSHGYIRAGGHDIISCENGRWTPLQLRCEKKKCGSAGELQNGRFEYTGVSFGDTATAKCHKGYHLIGEPVRHCRAEGWDGRTPVCDVVKCPNPPEVPGAEMFGPTDDELIVFGRVVSYRCLTGTLDGTPDIYCTEKGTWSAPAPQCREIKCPPLNILNGVVSSHLLAVNTAVTISCKSGFQLRGAEHITCDASGSWTPTIPTCEPYSGQCGQLPYHLNTVPTERQLGPYKHGSHVQFMCSHGYIRAGGHDIISCENGRWTPLQLRCESITCPPLNILNGVVSSHLLTVDTTVTVSCKSGFQLRGAKHITCEASGSWTPTIPTCEPDSDPGQCGQLPFHPRALPREGQLDLYKHGSHVRFRCSPGYIRAGGRDIISCENGRWTPLQFRCEKKKCGSAGELQNGRFEYTGVSFGDNATATCHEGYHLIGEPVRHCRAEGWDGRTPVCDVVKCPNPPEVPGAEMFGPTDDDLIVFGRVVSYRCLTGALDGTPDIYCTEKGTWSAPAPRCRGFCPFPFVKFGSILTVFRHKYQTGDSVTFTCNPGWSLVGSRTVTCGTDLSWKPVLPRCVRP